MELEHYYNPNNVPGCGDAKPLVDISHLTREEKRALLFKGGIRGERCKTEEELEIFLAARFEQQISHPKVKDNIEQIQMLWEIIELYRWTWHKYPTRYEDYE